MRKVFITTLVLCVASVAFWFSSLSNNDSIGHVTVIVSNQLGEVVINDDLNFTKSDSLLDILIENYDIGCADSSYNLSETCNSLTGNVVLKIDDVVTDWDNNYLAIYVNDTYSVLGIDSIDLHNGDVYQFTFTEYGGSN